MANHAICLLSYVADHPDEEQTYGSLSRATGIPKGTVWSLTHWNHELAPDHGDPLYVWAWNLNYDVQLIHKPNEILRVTRHLGPASNTDEIEQ